MCSIDSGSSPQDWHRARCPKLGICVQKSPMRKALFNVLYMKIWTFLDRSLFRHPCHIVPSVSSVLVNASTAYLVMSSMPKAVFCLIFDNFAPWRSKFRGTYVSMMSVVAFDAPFWASSLLVPSAVLAGVSGFAVCSATSTATSSPI